VKKVLLLALIASYFCSAYSYHQLEFTPPYTRGFWGAKTLALGSTATGEQFADPDSGLLGVWAGAWIGGIASYACQEVRFRVNNATIVHVSVELEYAGTDVKVGTTAGTVGLFSGLQFIYFLDGQGQIVCDLSSGFWNSLISNLIEVGFFTAKIWGLGLTDQITATQELIRNISGSLSAGWKTYKLMELATKLVQGTRGISRTVNFSFRVPPGEHRLGVGIQASVSATALGNSFATAFAYIKTIRMWWD